MDTNEESIDEVDCPCSIQEFRIRAVMVIALLIAAVWGVSVFFTAINTDAQNKRDHDYRMEQLRRAPAATMPEK